MSRRAILREPKQEKATESAVPWENPLVPHAVLREMYEKMLHARLLEEHVSAVRHGLKTKNSAAKGKKRAVETTKGQEACRVAVVQGLVEGDLVAEAQPGSVMAFLRGSELREALKSDGLSGVLPFVAPGRERLHAALGAAMALRAMKKQGGLVAYVKHGEVDGKVWKRVLSVASQQVLPIIFVALPASSKRGGNGEWTTVRKIAKGCRMPGIAVDGSDAIALYRVAQESLGRIRGDGGPVLIECVSYRLQGVRKGADPDPLIEMRKHLLERGAAEDNWIEQSGKRFAGILERSQREADRKTAR